MSSTETLSEAVALESIIARKIEFGGFDKELPILVTTLFSEILRSSRSYEAHQNAAEAALRLLAKYTENTSLPETEKVLWRGVVDGWVACRPNSSVEEEERETRFARHLAQIRNEEFSSRELLKSVEARMRERLNNETNEALRKVRDFALASDVEKDNYHMLRAIGRMLGYYADPLQIKTMAAALQKIAD